MNDPQFGWLSPAASRAGSHFKPITVLEVIALSVHAGDVSRTELIPAEAQGIDQEGAIRLAVWR